VQFEVVGDANGVLFSGVTFLASENVAVRASGNAQSSAVVLDCEFIGHTGRSVIEVYNGGIEGAEDIALVPDPLEQSMTILIVNCSMVDNDLSFATISNFNGIVFIDGTLFLRNQGQVNGLLVVRQGRSRISKSCFLSSTSTVLPGSVFLELGSVSLGDAENFGMDNTINSPQNCSDVFLETSGSCVENVPSCDGTCEAFSAPNCLARDFEQSNTTAPSSAPSGASGQPSEIQSQAPSTFLSPSLSASPSVTSLPTSLGCIEEWNELSLAVRKASMSNDGGIFTICPNTQMNVDMSPNPEITPIVISSSNTTIQCGTTGSIQNECVIFGGGRHFEIVGNASGIEILGLRFVGALNYSIGAFGSPRASVRFIDCVWNNGIGSHAVLIYGGQVPFPNNPDDSFIILENTASMNAEFDKCFFRDNALSFSVITNVGGKLTITSTVMTDNDVEFGVVTVTSQGEVALHESCFISNVITSDLGTITIDDNSTLVESQGNFGRGNSVGTENNCTGILLLQTEESLCVTFDADNCPIFSLAPTSAPTEAPSNLPSSSPSSAEQRQPSGVPSQALSEEPTPLGFTQAPANMNIPSSEPSQEPSFIGTPVPSFGCFSEWDRLSLAVSRACVDGLGGVFVMCSDTFFDVDVFQDPLITPIVIHASDITIQCGVDGRHSNNCTVSGGINQFRLAGVVLGAQLVGITFERSRGISVYAAASPESAALFVDCAWRNNKGSSAILMLELGSSNMAMTVGVQHSNFTDNEFLDAAITNVGGTLAISETVFWRNEAGDGAVAILYGGRVSLANSCFVENWNGAVNLVQSSELTRNEGNFGTRNEDCNGVLNKDDDLGIICGTACIPFDAQKCQVMDFDFDDASPTSSPTVSFQPICTGTRVPSAPAPVIPSMGPGSDLPSTSPSQTEEPTQPTVSSPPSENPSATIPPPMPSISSVPSSRPSRLRVPSMVPSERPSLQMDRTPVPSASENPTSEAPPTSFSYDYNFFYKFR
jgi:hypothetical protein